MSSLILLSVMLMLDSGISSLPAPVNVTISSVNFYHILRWDPGPGTPPGTLYHVHRVRYRKRRRVTNITTTTATAVQLKLKHLNEEYILTVGASHNHTESPPSAEVKFSPYIETIIDPPKVSLVGCGNCIHVNISLAEAAQRLGIMNRDIKAFYGIHYQVLWKQRGGKEVIYKTDERNFTLANLHSATEYCIQVLTINNVNKNTRPTAWHCVYTGDPPPGRGPLLIGAVTVSVVVTGTLTAVFFFLYYTGFICKLKATLPRAIGALSGGYTLTPERTTPDPISIIPDTATNRTATQPANRDGNSEEEEEEEEEDDGEHLYLNRPAELCSGQSSSENSGGGSGERTPATSWDCGGGGTEEVPDTRVEVIHDGVDQDDPGGVQGHDTGEEEEVEEVEEVEDSSGNVNLLSLTLSALAAHEEEDEEEEDDDEEQNTRDSLTDLLTTDLESHDQTAVALIPRLDFTASGNEGRRGDVSLGCDGETQREETSEDEEEEEDYSGYMRHS